MKLAVVPAINAHARVSILQKDSQTGSLPIAVPDVRPRDGAAFVIDESTQAILSSAKLTNEGPAILNGRSLTKWDASLPAFNVSAPNIGVVFALSGTTSWTTTGSLSSICAQPLVVCYAGSSSFQGLDYVRGFSTTVTGTPAQPVVRDVSLISVGPNAGSNPCGDTSAPSFVLNAVVNGTNCTLGVRAKILWGADTTPPANAVVKVANPGGVFGCPTSGNPKGCTMTYKTSGPNAGYWITETSGEFPRVPSAAGPLSMDLNWQTGTGGAKKSGVIAGVQRVFSASATTSGPIDFAQIVADGAVVGPTTLAYGSHTVAAAIGVAGNLENDSKFSDPTTVLRVADPSGSQNYAIDCDPAPRTFRDEIASGCQTAYQLNTGEACPNSTLPLDCAQIETGDKVGQLRQGMDARFASCPPNNWTNPGDPSQFPNIPAGDPRAIPIILVPFGSFKGSGSGWVPIVDFGTFYVTGWDYVGGSAPCSDNEPPPASIAGDHRGDIWGHFIKYVDSINTGETGGLCDFKSFGSCVAVLTD
jgi:hypothetical protein